MLEKKRRFQNGNFSALLNEANGFDIKRHSRVTFWDLPRWWSDQKQMFVAVVHGAQDCSQSPFRIPLSTSSPPPHIPNNGEYTSNAALWDIPAEEEPATVESGRDVCLTYMSSHPHNSSAKDVPFAKCAVLCVTYALPHPLSLSTWVRTGRERQRKWVAALRNSKFCRNTPYIVPPLCNNWDCIALQWFSTIFYPSLICNKYIYCRSTLLWWLALR